MSAEGFSEKLISGSGNSSESKNLILESPLIPKEDGFVVLECNASFPVDWLYSAGEGVRFRYQQIFSANLNMKV